MNLINDFNIKSLKTLELIEYLKKELQKYGEILAQFFPERIKRLSNSKLSKVWGMNVKKIIDRLRNGSSLTKNSIMKLRAGLNFYLGKNSDFCIELINKLEQNELDPITFIDELRKEVGRVSNLVKVEDREVSLLFFDHFNYLKYLKQWITNPNNPRYNPDFKLSLEQLENIKRVLEDLIGDKTNSGVSLINEYISNNPGLDEYSYQQFTISKPHFFDKIDTIDKAYWFGFLCADGSIYTRNNKYQISLELSKKDKMELIKFAQTIGFDKSRITDRFRIVKRKDGSNSISEMSRVRFSCRPMCQALIKNGKFGSKSDDRDKKIPNVIVKNLQKALSKNLNLTKTNEGRIGLAWLLGYFDGDGTVYRDRKNLKFSGEIISKSKSLLKQIKERFMIDNQVGFKDRKKETYRIALSPKVYRDMMSIYSNSMSRKRPG
jgi:hypothetical protein